MSRSTQVAFQLDDAALAAVDELATERSLSRAAVLRTAVHDLLARQREANIDAALAAGYGHSPPGAETAAWAELSVEGLEAGDLDW